MQTLPFSVNTQRRYTFASLLYESGLTTVDIGNLFGVSACVVGKAIKKRGVIIRPKGLSGDKNPMWKGDKAKCRETGHQRAQNLFPKLDTCERCKKVPAIERHHKDGNTLNNAESNIMKVCRRCHMLEDGRLTRLIATPKRPKLPPRPCRICERLQTLFLHGRCPQCSEFFRRNGFERPKDFKRGFYHNERIRPNVNTPRAQQHASNAPF